jgi:hypothetical protein
VSVDGTAARALPIERRMAVAMADAAATCRIE